MDAEPTGRLYFCARPECRTQVLICPPCDRGHIYCSDACSTMSRRRTVREAGRRYQNGRPGRLRHAERMRRYRAKKEKVTHQGSPPPLAGVLLLSDPAVCTVSALPVRTAPAALAYHCHFCGRRCSAFPRSEFLRGRRVQSRPRQGALQRGDDGGHSP